MRSVWVVAIFAFFVPALSAQTIPPGCESDITLELVSGRPGVVLMRDPNNPGTIGRLGEVEAEFLGHVSTFIPPTNPHEIDLDLTCLMSEEPLKVTPSRCGIKGPQQSIGIPPPDTQPVLTAASLPPYHSSIDYWYSMPNAAGQRRIRSVALISKTVLSDSAVGGTDVDGDGQTAAPGISGPVLIKAISCGTKYATETVEVGGEKSCERPKPEGGCPECVGSPVNTGSQNMRYQDADPLPGYSSRRTYDSRTDDVGFFGRRWHSDFDAKLVVFDDFDGLRYVTVTAPDRSWMVFEGHGGTYRQIGPGRDRDARLVALADGRWRQTVAGGREVREFSAAGKLAAIRDVSSGRETRFLWSAGLPVRVEDSWGNWALHVTTDSATRRITDIALDGQPGLSWHYTYDDHLMQVDSPLGVWRTYEYDMPFVASHLYRLVVVRDAAGNLIETHQYQDDSGRARTSYGAEGEIDSIVYGDGRNAREMTSTVRYKNGRVEVHYKRAIAGEWRTVELSDGCASCGQRDRAFVHDRYGNIVRAQAADGYVTTHTYDGVGLRKLATTTAQRPDGCDPATAPDRCRLTTDALKTAFLAATSATQGISYAYGDPHWPDRVTLTTTESVLVPGQPREERVTYDAATGEVLTRSETGWTDVPARQETRTTATLLYDGVEGAAFDPGGSFAASWLSLPQPLRRKSMDGPRADAGDVATFVYYPIDPSVPARLRGQLAALRDVLGHITRYESYDAFGHAQRVVDPNGVATEATYDAIGRRITSTVRAVSGCDTTADPLCATDLTWTSSYPGAGPLTVEQQPRGGVTSYTYDTRGRVATVSCGPSAADLREQIETSYDPDTGRKSLERQLARENGTWVEKRRVAYVYNLSEELSSVTFPGNASAAYQYDPAGRIMAHRDENHAAPNTLYAYDPAGRLRQVRQTLAPGLVTTTYGYDLHGNLTSVTDPNGNVTSYVYDDFGQLLSQQSPVSGTTTYEYDTAGNLRRTTDANGATTERTYDAANRLLTAVSTRAGVTETVTWTYDEAAAGPYALGRLTSMHDPSGVTRYAYERRGLLREERRTFLAATSVQTYGYDLDGNRTSLGYPSGRTVAYQYDYAARPLTATGSRAGVTTPYVTAAAYLPFGPMTSLTLGNGTVETRTFDARYQPLTASLTAGPVTLAHAIYATDPAGNITSIADATNAGYSRTFGYDDLHRLTTANTGSALWGNGAFTYDAMGNMLSATLGATQRTFVHLGTTSKIRTATGLAGTMAYDPAGNELRSPAGNPGDGSPAAVYSPRNLLAMQFVREYDRCREEYGSACIQADVVQIWRSNFYDGRGVRTASVEAIISHTIGGNEEPPQPVLYFYTPELSMLNVVAPSTGRTADVIWFGSRPVADHDATTVRYTHTDHLGTPFLQTSATATIVWHAEYEPFGTVHTLRAGTAMDDQPLRFPGQQVTYATSAGEESYNIFRWYRAGWGRYTQADPLGVAGGINLFGYVENNPASLSDLLGLMPVPKKDQSYRKCYPNEEAKCKASCKYGMEKCMVSRIFQVVVAKPGVVLKKWVDGPMSCSCKEPDCWDKLKEWADPKKWFDPNPTPPLPPFLPIPPMMPTPKPVIPGLPPFFINPCMLNPSLCDDRTGIA
jgi:RHS repeat-associated protein